MEKCRPRGGIFSVAAGAGRAVVLNIISRRLSSHSVCCDAKIFGDSLDSAMKRRSPVARSGVQGAAPPSKQTFESPYPRAFHDGYQSRDRRAIPVKPTSARNQSKQGRPENGQSTEYAIGTS